MNPATSIKEIMTTELITVEPLDALNKIRDVFNSNTFHHILVVEEGRQLKGIISEADLNKYIQLLAFDKDKAFHGPRKAVDIMTKSPVVVSPDDSIGLAADIFLANKFHALPVVEDDQLVGVVTTHDILKFCFKSPLEEK